ncbi:MAG TPA: peptide-methionine (S)-S-oxide reductase MsrA [Gemmatimonadaceae bacterium]|nr:peptide-methionine (S)-S-oxide reductase MsrA [Gemmatimonadaceae bacterium]
MFRFVAPVSIALLAGAAITLTQSGSGPAPAVAVPAPAMAAELRAGAPLDTAVFAGGCFWGIEAVFEHVRGVRSAVSGYAGGKTTSPSYEDVSTGSTGHAESVRVVYDPGVLSYGQLLQVFFSVAHDPTQLNRQGPDHGTQYRSAIFYRTPDQQRAAEAYVRQLTAAKTFAKPIVTQIVPLTAFYPAEEYHQDYIVHHPNQPYIVYNDAPKVENLWVRSPELYQ